MESALFTMDGKLAVASKEIAGGAQSCYREEQAKSEDVRSGFVADAYLANASVVGLVFDNIVKDIAGNMFRADNGDSLTFSAKGEPKDFLPDDIPELKSMLDQDLPSGQVFAGLGEEELKAQAKQLVQNLSDGDIEAIVQASGLDEETAKSITASLLGRKAFLVSRFHLEQSSSERVPIAIEKLQAQSEQLKGLELRPRVGILADADKIENQEVDIIDARDVGRYEVNFKLTAEHWQSVLEEFLLEKIATFFRTGGEKDAIYYTKATKDDSGEKRERNPEDGGVRMTDAFIVERDGIKVRISRNGENRSLLGVVHIEVPHQGTGLSSQEIGERVHAIFRDVLKIPDGLSLVTQEAERKYKKARYVWHHKLNSPDDAPEDVDARLARQEVSPGYFTFVEKDRHKEYQRFSPYVAHTFLDSLEALPKIVKSGGLLSTHERYRRGLFHDGMSSREDLKVGGADNVFVRTVTAEGLKRDDQEKRAFDIPRAALLLHPRIFDRTDWYAYQCDQYGRTDPKIFDTRQSPEQLFRDQKKNGVIHSNEQMFRCGIASKDILAIAVRTETQMMKVAKVLRKEGIGAIDGRPIEEMIILVGTFQDGIDVSGGKTEGTLTLANFVRENPDRVLEIDQANVRRFVGSLQENHIDKWDKYGKGVLEGTDIPEADYIYNRLGKAQSIVDLGLEQYFVDNYEDGGDLEISAIPELLRAEIIVKLESLLESMAKFIENLRTQKDKLGLGRHFDEYEKRVSKIKTGMAPIIESLKKAQTKS